MGDTRVRFVEFDRGSIDMETGEFPMILATDGEASDGDILNIEGAQFASRTPLQLSHVNDPTATLGSVSGFRRDMTGSPKKLRARGQIELTGEGAVADIRRDVAHMISNGHVSGISVSWEPIKFTPRVNLPPEHPAHVKESEKDWRKRTGFYHEKWRVREGSVVAIQADQAAFIGRAEETTGPVSQFWRAMADQATKTRKVLETEGTEDRQVEAPDVPEVQEPVAAETAPESPSEAAREAAAAAQLRELSEQTGLQPAELLRLAQETYAPEPTAEEQLAAALKRIDALEAQQAETRDQGRVPGEPAPPSLRTTQAMFDYLDARMEATHSKALALLHAAINVKRGKVVEGQTPHQQLKAEAEALLAEMRREKDEEADEPIDMGPLVLALDERLDKARRHAERAVSAAVATQRAQDKLNRARETLTETLRSEG